MSTSKNSLAFWESVKPGSFITLSDVQSMETSRLRGFGLKGLDFPVKSINIIKESNNLCVWFINELVTDTDKVYLVVKVVDDTVSYGVYTPIEPLTPGTREDMINRGWTWLFEPPTEPLKFPYFNLKYTDQIPHETGLVFNRKAPGELEGSYRTKPNPSGQPNLLATVVEYTTDQEIDNNQILIVEAGQGDTSHIEFFQGALVNENDVEVLKK